MNSRDIAFVAYMAFIVAMIALVMSLSGCSKSSTAPCTTEAERVNVWNLPDKGWWGRVNVKLDDERRCRYDLRQEPASLQPYVCMCEEEWR